MKREFLLNIAFLIVLNLLIKPFYIFGIDRTVQNVLGPEIYGGAFAVLLNFVYLFQIVNDFGIQNFTSRHISKHPKVLAKYFPQFISLKIVMGILFMILVMCSGYFMGFNSSLWPILALLAFNQVLISFIFYFRANLAGLGHYRLDSLLSIMDKLLLIIFCSVLLWGISSYISFTVYHFVLAQTAALVLTFMLAFILLFPHVSSIKFVWSDSKVLAILKQSFPYALILFLTTIYTRVDSVMINFLLPDGDYEAGAYASAFKLLETSNMFSYLFGMLLLPMFSKLFRNHSSVQPLFEMSTKIIWVMSVFVTTIVVLYRNEIMVLLYTYATDYWAEILGVLMLGYIAGAISYILGALIQAQGCLKQINILYVIGALTNVGLNWILIPEYKALGAAFTTLVTQGIVVIGAFIIIRRHVPMKLGGSYYLSLLGYILFAGMFYRFWSQYRAFIPGHLVVHGILVGIVFLTVAVLLGLIPVKLKYFREVLRR